MDTSCLRKEKSTPGNASVDQNGTIATSEEAARIPPSNSGPAACKVGASIVVGGTHGTDCQNKSPDTHETPTAPMTVLDTQRRGAATSPSSRQPASLPLHEQKTYYVIRKCSSLRSPALFKCWEDCRFHVEKTNGDDVVEYKLFHSLTEATAYMEVNVPPTTTPKNKPPVSTLGRSSIGVTNENGKRPASSLGRIVDLTATKQYRSHDAPIVSDHWSWDQRFLQLCNYKRAHGTCLVNPKYCTLQGPFHGLDQFARAQQDRFGHHNRMEENDRPVLNVNARFEKIRMINIGFDFSAAIPDAPVNDPLPPPLSPAIQNSTANTRTSFGSTQLAVARGGSNILAVEPSAWDRRYDLLMEYQKEFGTHRVNRTHCRQGKYKSLDSWVRAQADSMERYQKQLEKDPIGNRDREKERKFAKVRESGALAAANYRLQDLFQEPNAADAANTNDQGVTQNHNGTLASATQARDLTQLDGVAAGRTLEREIKWDQNLSLLRQYKAVYNTISVQVKNCEGNAFEPLFQWVKGQRSRLRALRARQKKDADAYVNASTAYEIMKLKEIGLYTPLETTSDRWQMRYEEAQAFKLKHGHCKVKRADNYPLFDWLNRMKGVLRDLQEDPEAPCPLGEAAIQKLKELDLHIHPKRTTPMARSGDWDEMFEQLQAFKEENGHCNVPTGYPRTPLSNWIMLMRFHYKQMKEGKKHKLDPEKLQKLTQLGFSFYVAPARLSFEERAMEWLTFKTKYGRDPSPDDVAGAGQWVLRMRRKRNQFNNGERTNITQEQIDKLTAWGFRWETGSKKPNRENVVPPKSWEERLQELLEYKKENGHVNVPQKDPLLGQFVHHQRRQYRRLKQGKQSSLTPERMRRLKEIGFIWITRKRPTKPKPPGEETRPEVASNSDDDGDGNSSASDMEGYDFSHARTNVGAMPFPIAWSRP